MDISVLPGFHVNSDKPKDEFLIPLKLTWNPGPLQATSISYPKPEEIQVGTQMLAVFTGSFNIRTEFKALPACSPRAGDDDRKAALSGLQQRDVLSAFYCRSSSSHRDRSAVRMIRIAVVPIAFGFALAVRLSLAAIVSSLCGQFGGGRDSPDPLH